MNPNPYQNDMDPQPWKLQTDKFPPHSFQTSMCSQTWLNLHKFVICVGWSRISGWGPDIRSSGAGYLMCTGYPTAWDFRLRRSQSHSLIFFAVCMNTGFLQWAGYPGSFYFYYTTFWIPIHEISSIQCHLLCSLLLNIYSYLSFFSVTNMNSLSSICHIVCPKSSDTFYYRLRN